MRNDPELRGAEISVLDESADEWPLRIVWRKCDGLIVCSNGGVGPPIFTTDAKNFVRLMRALRFIEEAAKPAPPTATKARKRK